MDKTIRIWNIKLGNCQKILDLSLNLNSRQRFVTRLKLSKNILIYADRSGIIKTWDILNDCCPYTLEEENQHRAAVTGVLCNENFIVTSSEDGTVKLWDIHTGLLYLMK